MNDSSWDCADDFSLSVPREGSTRRIERMSLGAGAAVVERLGDNVIRIELSGRVGMELGQSVMAAAARELNKLDRFQLFLDFELLDEYPPSLRQRATEFLMREPAKLVAAHGLARARMVSMALSVANLSLDGKLSVHADRLGYENALRDAVHGPGAVRESVAIACQ